MDAEEARVILQDASGTDEPAVLPKGVLHKLTAAPSNNIGMFNKGAILNYLSINFASAASCCAIDLCLAFSGHPHMSACLGGVLLGSISRSNSLTFEALISAIPYSVLGCGKTSITSLCPIIHTSSNLSPSILETESLKLGGGIKAKVLTALSQREK